MVPVGPDSSRLVPVGPDFGDGDRELSGATGSLEKRERELPGAIPFQNLDFGF
jgi:hypothetical protein